jgi:hypothetical protein
MTQFHDTYGKFCAHGIHVDEECDDCAARYGEQVDCRPDFSDIPMPEVTITPAQHASLIARVRAAAPVAALALFLSVTTTHAAPDLTACYPAGATSEGFPVVHCPLTGSTYYIDMDGSDGTLGHQDDGRWMQLP